MRVEEVRRLLQDAAHQQVALWVEGGQLQYRAPVGGLSATARARLRSARESLIAELAQPEYVRGPRPGNLIALPLEYAGWWTEAAGHLVTLNGTHFVCRVRGNVAVGDIQKAFARLPERHELLRARAQIIDQVPYLQFAQPRSCQPVICDLSAANALQTSRIIEQAIWREFGDGQLFRCFIFRVAPGDYLCGFVFNHCLGDLHSCNILARDALSAASGEADQCPNPLQFCDYLRGRERWYRGEILRYRMQFWSDRLAGAEPVQLPGSCDINPRQSYVLETAPFEVTAAQRQRLVALAEDAGVSMLILVLAAMFVAVAALAKRDDLLMTIIVSGRDQPALLDMIGTTVAYMPIRMKLADNQSLTDFLHQLQEEYSLCCRYRVPWDPILETLGCPGRVCISPLLNFIPEDQIGRDSPTPTPRVQELQIERVFVKRPVATGGGLLNAAPKMTIHDTGRALYGSLAFIREQSPGELIQGFIETWMGSLERFAADPDLRIGQMLYAREPA